MTSLEISRRLQLTAVLVVSGALIGAITAAVLSFLATAVAQSLSPTGRVGYTYSLLQFAIAGGIGTPILAWFLMRRVPLWRAICEPALGGTVGTLVAVATIPSSRCLSCRDFSFLWGYWGQLGGCDGFIVLLSLGQSMRAPAVFPRSPANKAMELPGRRRGGSRLTILYEVCGCRARPAAHCPAVRRMRDVPLGALTSNVRG